MGMRKIAFVLAVGVVVAGWTEPLSGQSLRPDFEVGAKLGASSSHVDSHAFHQMDGFGGYVGFFAAPKWMISGDFGASLGGDLGPTFSLSADFAHLFRTPDQVAPFLFLATAVDFGAQRPGERNGLGLGLGAGVRMPLERFSPAFGGLTLTPETLYRRWSGGGADQLGFRVKLGWAFGR